MIDLMDLAKEHGLWAAVSITLFPWVWSLDKQLRKTKGELDNVHGECHIPIGALHEIKDDVSELKRDNHTLDNRFVAIETSFARFERIETKLDEVLMHLTKKGIDN